jgi:hypothetical protein
MGGKMRKQARTKILVVRVTVREEKRIKEIVKANSGTVSEFVRVCINSQLAQSGDPESMKNLSMMFERGISEFVQTRVKTEIERAKAEHEAKK